MLLNDKNTNIYEAVICSVSILYNSCKHLTTKKTRKHDATEWQKYKYLWSCNL